MEEWVITILQNIDFKQILTLLLETKIHYEKNLSLFAYPAFDSEECLDSYRVIVGENVQEGNENLYCINWISGFSQDLLHLIDANSLEEKYNYFKNEINSTSLYENIGEDSLEGDINCDYKQEELHRLAMDALSEYAAGVIGKKILKNLREEGIDNLFYDYGIEGDVVIEEKNYFIVNDLQNKALLLIIYGEISKAEEIAISLKFCESIIVSVRRIEVSLEKTRAENKRQQIFDGVIPTGRSGQSVESVEVWIEPDGSCAVNRRRVEQDE